MLDFLNNAFACKRFIGMAMLSLCLAGCEQQQVLPVATTPLLTSPTQPDRYYLNAQLASKEEIEQFDPKSITQMDVLRGKQAADYAHDMSVKGIILVQTR